MPGDHRSGVGYLNRTAEDTSTLLVDGTWDFAEGAHTTCFLSCVGFGDRLLSEVKKLAPKDVKIRVGAISFVFITYYVCCSVAFEEPC